MVKISASAVPSSAARPTTPMRLALAANWVSADSTGRAMASGTRFCSSRRSSAPWKEENIGKAENAASITVSSGTSAISVMKVRLPAVTPSRSSRKRVAAMRQASASGPRRCSHAAAARAAAGASDGTPARADRAFPAAGRADASAAAG